jgi:hypothetical protein
VSDVEFMVLVLLLFIFTLDSTASLSYIESSRFGQLLSEVGAYELRLRTVSACVSTAIKTWGKSLKILACCTRCCDILNLRLSAEVDQTKRHSSCHSCHCDKLGVTFRATGVCRKYCPETHTMAESLPFCRVWTHRSIYGTANLHPTS